MEIEKNEFKKQGIRLPLTFAPLLQANRRASLRQFSPQLRDHKKWFSRLDAYAVSDSDITVADQNPCANIESTLSPPLQAERGASP